MEESRTATLELAPKKLIEPFDSFTAVYKILNWAGYFRLLKKPKSRFKQICHQIYRPLAFLVTLWYNFQHLFFIYQVRDDMDQAIEGLAMTIPQINLVTKFLALNLYSANIDKIHELLHDRIFAANSVKDEELLMENKREMHGLSKFVNIGITISVVFWIVSPFVRRMQDETAVVPLYVPFETKSWLGYTGSVILESIPVLWIGYGHMAIDCVIATYFAQARVQLKIIKYNLTHLCDSPETEDDVEANGFQYIDDVDTSLKQRFVYYVQRYDKLIWYMKELNQVFNKAMSFQFFSSSSAMCLVIYKMSATDTFSVPFMFLGLLFCILQTQVLLYCYYGGLVEYESRSINEAVYSSGWLSTSPKFRRLLLIAMIRWSKPIVPTVSAVIPLSLPTFISLLRSSYTLFTVLKTTK